jgi:hypothetical protein
MLFSVAGMGHNHLLPTPPPTNPGKIALMANYLPNDSQKGLGFLTFVSQK